MNLPIEPYPGSDTSLIGEELEKLFVFQDKHLSREKKAIFVEEIEKSSFPVSAVIQGIRSLVAEDLSSIKLLRILAAIRSFTVSKHELSAHCEECHDGIVFFRNEKNYEFARRCKCLRGQERPKLV